ncbi:hypothetical protein BDZ89DRAFT_1144874 [Hymenopellis radicata]|nr:hypothetical protein BDZ89DRAFT_1144874 [Hymenopellis radicata]
MWPRRYDLSGAFDTGHPPSSSVSEAEEGPLKMRRVTGDSFASSSSEASEPTPEPATEATTGSEQTTPSETAPPEPELAPPPAAPLPSPTTLAPPQDTEQQPTARTLIPILPLALRVKMRYRLTNLRRRMKYQDFLPPQGVQDLAKTALAPRIIVSESDQEYPASIVPRNVTRDLAQ